MDVCDHFWVDDHLAGIPARRCVTCGKVIFKAVQDGVLSAGDIRKASNPFRIGDALGIPQASGPSLHEVMAEIVSRMARRSLEDRQ